MVSSRISAVLESIRSLSEPIRAHGAKGSAHAYLLLRWAMEASTPLVALCPDAESAATLAEDFEALSVVLTGQAREAWVIPGWDPSPYSPISPSIRTRIERIAALQRMRAAKAGTLFLLTLESGVQATLPPESLEAHTLKLDLGGSIQSRDLFAQRLAELGYQRVDPVEDPGTFAIRGEIIDLFPPDVSRPLRIELFGDEIERLREFDPATQRADSADTPPLRSVLVGPAREVLLHRQNLSRVRGLIKQRADDLGVSRSLRDPVLASVEEGIFPSHADCWAPFAYETSATALDHVPAAWPVAWIDELSSLQHWDAFLARQREEETSSGASGVIAPELSALYPWTSELEQRLRSRVRLFLDRLETADLRPAREEPETETSEPSTRHRLSVATHVEGEARFGVWLQQRFRVLAMASTQSQLERVRFLLEEKQIPCRLLKPETPQEDRLAQGVVSLAVGSLSSGFRWASEGVIVINEDEILGTRHVRKQKKPRTESGSAARDWSGLQALSDLSPGDAIVHVEHGIGRYQGLSRLSLSGAPADFLLIEYASKDKLYLPVYRLNVIQKYSGSGESLVLDKLGGAQFQKAKEKVKEAVKRLAVDLVKIYAERKIRPGAVFPPRDAVFQEFESRFPFEETPDQLQAIDRVLEDLASGRVMDRLVCGDVGYGKTEVAMRAAFRVANEGKQVAVLVPTTILAHQHEQNFASRFRDTPLQIASLSRFKSAKEQKELVQKVSSGAIDILIGTHRLLSRDIGFRDLGLVIVDEEQRFGVEHKERLKTLKINTHVLTLSATPIPRTLHMALSGLRDISLINTPPVDRLPIRTYVSRQEDSLIQQAIQTELRRGGQVFLVHNRVQTIHGMAERVRELVPEARVVVGHGQMAEKELEEVMVSFYEKRANVLVCTTIIESGLDLPSANTLIVTRADMFGLAQLYQIRGRVGRGQARAYAYLLLPPEGAVTEDAKKRLEIIQRFVELGSGFSIASHDLDLRGGGDLLGPAQSGHIAAVGFDLYTELLEEAIQELQGKPLEEETSKEPEIKVPYPAFLSEAFVPDEHQRLSLYRKLSGARSEEELIALEEELKDRYGSIPEEGQNLLWLIRIKILLKRAGVESLTAGTEKVALGTGAASRLDPARAIALVSSKPSLYQLTPGSRFVAHLPAKSLRDLYFQLEKLLTALLPRSA